MLNLKTQNVSHGEENLDDTNPFSPTFGAHAQHVYIPIHGESKGSLCKNVCCVILSIIIFVFIVVVVIVLIQ